MTLVVTNEMLEEVFNMTLLKKLEYSSANLKKNWDTFADPKCAYFRLHQDFHDNHKKALKVMDVEGNANMELFIAKYHENKFIYNTALGDWLSETHSVDEERINLMDEKKSLEHEHFFNGPPKDMHKYQEWFDSEPNKEEKKAFLLSKKRENARHVHTFHKKHAHVNKHSLNHKRFMRRHGPKGKVTKENIAKPKTAEAPKSAPTANPDSEQVKLIRAVTRDEMKRQENERKESKGKPAKVKTEQQRLNAITKRENRAKKKAEEKARQQGLVGNGQGPNP